MWMYDTRPGITQAIDSGFHRLSPGNGPRFEVQGAIHAL